MTEKSNIATLPTRSVAQVADVFSNPAEFEHAQRIAKVFAGSALVPKHFHGNLPDCLIAYQIARRLNEEPLTVLQNIFIVNGRPGWLTSYMISRANRAGVFKTRITWSSTGEGAALAVTASTVMADSGEVVSVTCDMAMARAEGWTKNPKYTSMPEHMLRWRSAAMLIRLFAPEVMIGGLPVVEELETLPAAPRDITPATERMRKTLDDFAAGTNIKDEPEQETATPEEASVQEDCLASSAPGQGASGESAGPPLAPSGAPAATASAEEKVARTAAEKTEARTKPTTGPKTEAEYVEHANAWIDGTEDADLLEQQWKGEKTLRNKANVTIDVREQLKAKAEAKVAKLRGQPVT